MDQATKQQRLQNRLGPEIKAFRANCRTLQLATVDAQGKPNVSYAPFAQLEDGFYILISEIARHARNLQQNPQVSLMMIEDESGAKQIYARQRLSFDANAELVMRDTTAWQTGISALSHRFGDIIDSLSGLADFHLFRLKPENGLYVKGFGQAFQVGSDDFVDMVHLDQGHRKLGDSQDVRSTDEIAVND
ncbi:heme utilization protein HutZ [Salinivibrio kushneri]|uniref:heme utilization protein HutZ n=1 Tax=Salinivibrio kushneri TaxID=1908198 RepID=UPI0009886732|nr:heme utilization protein HutZ [Salinivibrio kushneri]OOE33996.1 heme utilization protein HutZ [Salinivibrio kushneri]OOE53881.1 heme utilization protein HutZ [Salinivibrio kushneri]